MQTYDGQRSDEPPGRRTFRTLMAESRPFQGIAVPGDERVPSALLLRQGRETGAGRESEDAYVSYQDLFFGVGMGIC